MKKLYIWIGLFALAFCGPGKCPVAEAREVPPEAKILIAYFSAGGNTREMAEAVAGGAESLPGTEVRLRSLHEVAVEDLLWADAILVGSPVYNANVAPEVQEFINSWPFDGSLRNKIGAAFVSAAGISAGEELVQLSILRSMLIFGMVVVGGGEWQSAFGASAIVQEIPMQSVREAGATAAAVADGSVSKSSASGGNIPSLFLANAAALGVRVAQLARRLGEAAEVSPGELGDP